MATTVNTVLVENFDLPGEQLNLDIKGDFIKSTTVSKDGSSASFTNKDIGDNELSYFVLKFNIPKMNYVTDATVSFDYKLDTEASYDRLLVWLDGTRVILDSGKKDWNSYKSPNLATGDHLLTVQYKKDSSMSIGADSVYIDSLVIKSIGELY